MTKVKIFSDPTPAQLEAHINEFIQGKNVIDIKYDNMWYPTKSSENGGIAGIDVLSRALIIYQED